MPTDLFEPLTLSNGLRLPNRIAKAAMTENLADARNQPTVRLERLYRRWARGGAGLLISGNLMVDRRFLERSRNVVLDDHTDMVALRNMVAATGDTPFLAQLNHPGRQCNRYITRRPVAPSAVDAVALLGSFARPRALAAAEVEAIVQAFGEGARRCEDAGFDGVQVHAAHGYLLAQFLSPATNRRTDRWGGAVAGRARALLEAVRACRARTGDGFTIAVKLNSSDFRHGGFTTEDAGEVVTLLAEEGIDLLEVSGGTYESPALLGLADGQQSTAQQPTPYKEAYFADFARSAKAASPDLPVMLTGGIRSAAAMRDLLADGVADVIGLGRPLVVDPSLPQQLEQGADRVDLPDYTMPKLLALAGESEWYEAQIARLADGEDPDPGLNPYLTAARFVGGELLRGLGEGPARRRLAGG